MPTCQLKINPHFLSDAKGEKIGVMLTMEEFRAILAQLESMEEIVKGEMEEFEGVITELESLEEPVFREHIHKKVKAEVVPENEKVKTGSKKKRTKTIFGKTSAETDFEKTEAAMEIENAEDEMASKPNNFYTKSIITGPVAFEMEGEFCSAKGLLLADGKSFRVLKGSKASGVVDDNLPNDIISLREELKMLRVLEDDEENGDMTFTRNYEFDNPTIAASAIAASPCDGGHYWISSKGGKAMRQY